MSISEPAVVAERFKVTCYLSTNCSQQRTLAPMPLQAKEWLLSGQVTSTTFIKSTPSKCLWYRIMLHYIGALSLKHPTWRRSIKISSICCILTIPKKYNLLNKIQSGSVTPTKFLSKKILAWLIQLFLIAIAKYWIRLVSKLNQVVSINVVLVLFSSFLYTWAYSDCNPSLYLCHC